jgi:hypothetical protein
MNKGDNSKIPCAGCLNAVVTLEITYALIPGANGNKALERVEGLCPVDSGPPTRVYDVGECEIMRSSLG